jgi:tRNA(Ile2) C34 agmatinyltransferase TiaS
VNEKTKVKIFTEDSMIESIKAKFKGAPDVTFEMTNKKIFAIKHSPCPVSYNIEGFKIKNQDELTP